MSLARTFKATIKSAAQKTVANLGYEIQRKSTTTPERFDRTKWHKYDEFVRDDGSIVDLLEGYRDHLKGHWRLDYWPAKALYSAAPHVHYSTRVNTVLDAFSTSPTLPIEFEAFAELAHEVAQENPSDFVDTNVRCPITGYSIIAHRTRQEQALALAGTYKRVAQGVLANVTKFHPKLSLSEANILEVGCGMGYASFALGSAGTRNAIGLEFNHKDPRASDERAQVFDVIADSSGGGRRPHFVSADAMQTPCRDSQFDVVFSVSVLEHIKDPTKLFREMARILKPDGIFIHSIDPFFSPRGGHAACTLDFPWGHARLDTEEAKRYLEEKRPHEAAHASWRLENHFSEPRMTFHSLENAITDAGLLVTDWQEKWLSDHLPTSQHVHEVQQNHPSATARDLATHDLVLIGTPSG